MSVHTLQYVQTVTNFSATAAGSGGGDLASNGVFSLIHFGSRGLGIGDGGSVGSLER